MSIKLWIDDIRDPARYLTPEQADGIVWIKDWWEARNFLFDNHTEIEVLHLDNYLGDPLVTGKDLFFIVAGETMWGGREQWANLKQIYLHSSDKDMVEDLMENYAEPLHEAGVELINNSQENNY